MRWVFCLLAALFGMSAQAQTVRVTTGDHDGFTRLVLESPGLNGWRLSRLPDGYSLTLRRPVDFDLTQAFRVITRARLAALAPRADRTGLDLTLGCACHAIGFDYRPGVLVIDLRDGPPPDGSSFELAADGSESAPLQPASPPVRPRPRPQSEWDWTTAAISTAQGAPPVPVPGPEALALKQVLLSQFSDGVARGLLAPATSPPSAVPTSGTAASNARAGLMALPGVAGLSPSEPRPPLAPNGKDCPAADRIDLPSWGDPNLPPAAQISSMESFLGEFDRPDPDALTAAIRQHLWLGFGVEAQVMIDVFAADAPDAALWRSMAKAVDGRTDPDNAFAGMGGCDSAAALWSAALDDRLSPAEIAVPALLAAFSSLPPHLRDAMGTTLAERFVAAGDRATAQSLKDAMARGNPGSGSLVDARLALSRNASAEAESLARAQLAQGGPEAGAAMALIVEARFQAREPLITDDVTALEAIHEELPSDPDIARAVVISNALAGNFDAAFAHLATIPESSSKTTITDLWSLLAELGPDSALIQHAAAAENIDRSIPRDTRQRMAGRLTALGFGAAAKAWLGTDGDPVMVAAADLARGDARAALTRSAGLAGPEAEAIRAKALLALGEPAGAADLLEKGGAETAELALSTRIQARDWAYLRNFGPPGWQAVAGELAPTPQNGGPLADGHSVLTQSAATRAAIDRLLEEIPVPSANP